MSLQAGKETFRNVRTPAVAGQFYPDGADTLRKAIEAFMADAMPVRVSKPLALIVPHAGYIFSGQIAADAYSQVRANAYDTVVILGDQPHVPPPSTASPSIPETGSGRPWALPPSTGKWS